ncbi:MAG: type II toxin-antitoxin system RelE/ParE family toxin [Endomicrobia bacterium]|nr:type II toxin-antitoxin system RelE/ParE family toxin [Endomicrobiia bacterium]
MSDNPRPLGVKKLKEKVYRIRVGDYRIVYFVDDTEKVVTILKIGHRKEVYR